MDAKLAITDYITMSVDQLKAMEIQARVMIIEGNYVREQLNHLRDIMQTCRAELATRGEEPYPQF